MAKKGSPEDNKGYAGYVMFVLFAAIAAAGIGAAV